MANTKKPGTPFAASATRRSVLAGMAATPVALAAGGQFASAQPAGTLSITILDVLEVSLKPVFEAYQAARPGVTVDYALLPTGDDATLRQALLSRRMANRLPDITYLIDIYATQFAEAGITADMRTYLDAGGPIKRGSFAEPFLNQYLIASGPNEGGIHGLPQGADTVVLMYNKRHFDEAGLDHPTDDWTFEKQVEAATALTQKSGDTTTRYGLAVQVPWHATYVPGIECHGDTLLDDDGLYKLTSDASVSTFSMYWEQVNNGVFASTPQLSQFGGAPNAFASGVASMVQMVRAVVPVIREGLADDWDVALIPTINGNRRTGMGSIALALTPAGEENNRELAYDFLDWFYSEQGGMGVLASTYAIVPPVTELYESPIWRDLPAPPSRNHVFSDSIAFGTMNPTTIPANVQGIVNDELNQAEERVVLGGNTDIAGVLAAAQETINTAMARELDN